MYRFAIASAALALLSTAAPAQIGNPAGLGVDTKMEKPGVIAPHQTNNQDRLFAQLAAAGGLAEVDLGEMTDAKATADSVKTFARMMVTDHTSANDRLKALADTARIPLPDKLDPDHATMRAKLESLDGRNYDLAYIKGQIVDHQKTSQLLQWEISSGENFELQKFAAEILPVVLEHLRHAQEIHTELTGAAVR